MQLQQCFKIPVQRYVTYHFENALKTMKDVPQQLLHHERG